MPNTNFVPNWTFERTLPSPFDSYSGKSAVMKDIASKYCNQPKKRATLHSATLQAVFSYMDLENPPAGKAEEELGAIGSQANNFTIAEYPSRTGLLHVVVYNRMTGKFIAGKYEKPLDLDSKPEPYQFKKDEDSGSALYFALMPTFLSDDEFNEKYQELKQHRDDGFPDLPKAAETAAVLCDNVYRRIRYGDSLPIGNIKVDTPANGVLQRLTPSVFPVPAGPRSIKFRIGCLLSVVNLACSHILWISFGITYQSSRIGTVDSSWGVNVRELDRMYLSTKSSLGIETAEAV